MPNSRPMSVAKVLDTESPLVHRVSFEGLEHFVQAALRLVEEVLRDAKSSASSLQIDVALLPAGDSIAEFHSPDLAPRVLSALEQRLNELKRPHVTLPVALSLLFNSGPEDAPAWRAPFPRFLGGRPERLLDQLLCERAGVTATRETPSPDPMPMAHASFLSHWWRRVQGFLGLREGSGHCPISEAFDQGCTESNAGDWIARLNNHLDEHVGCAGSLARRGGLYLSQGNFASAVEDLTSAMKSGGEDPACLRDRARAYIGLEELQTALVDLDRALALLPADVELLAERAALFARLEDWEAAIRDYDLAIEYEPLSPRLRVIAAQAFANGGNQGRAFEELSTAVALDPYLEQAYRLRGILGMLRGSEQDRRQAADDFSAALALDSQDAIAFFYRAQLRAGLGDLAGAGADCDQAIALDSSLVGAYAVRSEVRCRLNDFQGAIDDATRAIEQQATPFLYIVRGQAWFGLPDTERAAEDFRTALELDSSNAQAHHALGATYEHTGDADEAFAAFSAAIELAPQWAQPYLDRGNCSRGRGDDEAALADYSEAIRLAPELVSALMNRGLILAEQGEIDAALADFSTSARLEPDAARVRLLLAKCLFVKGENPAAIEEFTRSVELDPSLTEAYADRARAYLQQQDFRSAIDDFSEALEQAPTLASAYFGRSLAWMHLGEDARSDEDFREAVQCEPGEAENFQFSRLLSEAVLRQRQERFDEAIACCDGALELVPDSTSALGMRAAACWYSDQLVEAADDFSRVLALHDDSHEALSGRGQVYAEMGEYQQALTDLDNAIQLVKTKEIPGSSLAYALSGRALAKAGLGRLEESMDDFAQSIGLCPGNAWVYYNLGLVYHQSQESTKAAICLKLALRLDDPALTPRKRRRANSYLEAARFEV